MEFEWVSRLTEFLLLKNHIVSPIIIDAQIFVNICILGFNILFPVFLHTSGHTDTHTHSWFVKYADMPSDLR